MEIDRGTGPAVWTNHGEAIYVNADKSAIVPGDSPEAAYLLVAEGGTLPLEEAQKYDLIGSQLPERGRGRPKTADGPLSDDDRALADAEEQARRLEEDERKAKKGAPENKAKDAPEPRRDR
jgi:hypothetical protein